LSTVLFFDRVASSLKPRRSMRVAAVCADRFVLPGDEDDDKEEEEEDDAPIFVRCSPVDGGGRL
jgi:hypothetical protein